MRKSVSLVILMILFRFPLGAGATDWQSQKTRTPMSALNVSGLPTQIIKASIESMIVSSWVNLEVYNTLPETIQELRLRVFKYSNSKLIQTADGVVIDPVRAGSHRYRTLVDVTLEPGTQAAVVITGVKTSTAIWSIQPDVLDKEIQVKGGATAKLQSAVTYERNITLTADDKAEILATVLNEIARDPDKAERLGKHRMLISRADCSCATGLSAAVPAELLSLDEIQTIADNEQRAVYIRCGEFKAEGSRVRVHLILNDRLARPEKPTIVTPFRYNFQFVLLKNGKNWVIEESEGYT